MVVSLITISRNNPLTDQEQTILDRTLRVLDEAFDGVPVLKDLLDVIIAAPDELRQVALDRGDKTVYLQETRALEATLLGLTGGGKLGEIFSRQTTNPMRRDRAVVLMSPASTRPKRTGRPPCCWPAGPTASAP
jgi:hypothetical protein